MKGCINSAADVERYTGSRLIGEVYYERDTTGLAGIFHSKLVDRYHYESKNECAIQVNKLNKTLHAICEHIGISTVTLFSLTGSEYAGLADDTIKQVTAFAENNGVSVINSEIRPEFDEESLLDVETAVLIICPETKISDLSCLKSLCQEYEINMLGGVFLSKI